METISIKLSREVYKCDAEKMANWLSDKEISSNLNEGVNARENIINLRKLVLIKTISLTKNSLV